MIFTYVIILPKFVKKLNEIWYIPSMKILITLLPLLLITASCSRSNSVTVKDDEGIGTAIVTQPVPVNGKVQDPVWGEEVYLSIAALSGVNDYNANGVGQSHYFDGGTYIHTIQLNVQQASDGYFYEGWLVQEGSDPISTGHLRSPTGDVRHNLRFETMEDLRSYEQVMITLERDDGNPDPGEQVAEGTLKTRQR